MLNSIRKEFLKLDLDQQVLDLQAGELTLADALKDWTARATVDAVNGKKFRCVATLIHSAKLL